MARTKKSEDSVKEVKYEHYVKPVKILENFEEIYKLKYHLISSYEELLDFYNNKFDPNSFFAWDTETTDLNPEKGKLTDDLTEGRIVGYSFTQNGNDGYYVPLTHPDIAIGYKGLKVLYAMVSRSKLNLLYNARFDMRFLEHMTPEKYDYIPEPGEKIYPFDLSKIKYFDVQCSVWLSDTNVPMPSLKKSEKHFLGWNPPTFADTMGDETNFGYIPAEQGCRYAIIDALGTYHLFFKTEKYYTESGAAGKLDNEVLYPLMKLENTPIYVDHEYLKKMRVDIVKHLAELKQYLYDKIGIEYNINSGRELVAVFQQLGIDTGQRTATGIMKTDIKTIDNYLVEHNDNSENGEYLRKLVEYKKLTKFDNSYLEKLIKVSSAEEVNKHPIRFNYFTARVPCLTENNRVLIKDKGLVSIKDCKSGDYIWTQYGYKKVLWNNSHFANDIYKVTFKNGYTIEGTGHHPILVNKTGRSTYLKYEWAGLADLKPGEHIVLNHKPCENYNTDIEYDFARLIGFIDGDGSIATQDRVKLCYWTGESNELKEYYGNLLSKYSNSKLHYDLSQEESHHAIVQAVYNTKFNTYLHSLGVRGDGVPKCILNSSPKIWLAYLQGIWDSDGNISLNNDNRKCPQVGIKLIKKQTVHDIGLMLLMLGIPNSLLDINYYKNKLNCHEQLRCRIRDHIGYVLFKNLISDYMKSNKRLKFESLNIDNNYIEYAQTTVKSIEKIEGTIVYDIEVEDVHEYIANGIVTHNTGRLACGTDGKNTFFSPINFQSLPKPHSHNYYVHKATSEQIANNEDLCGYIFNDDPNGSLGLTEGQDPHLNVRKAFVPKPNEDSVIVSVDMCLEGGSPVQSKRGYIGISELKVGDEVFTPNGYAKVIRVKNTGIKQLYKIKTSGQTIYCSEDHPFMINNKQVPANEIKDVLIQENLPTYIEHNIKKEQLFNKFKDLHNITSIVEKANYIKNNNLIDYFVEAYNNYTAADVAKMCFIKKTSFRHLINYLNLNTICHKSFCKLPYQHVFNPFNESNPTSAYLLGYILGDGNINIRRNNYYTLNITSKDYAHINQIKNIFNNTIKLLEHNKNGYKAWSLTIVDQDVCNDLIKLGIKPRKSYINTSINFDWLGDNFSHFIRGLFDADGCISVKNSNSLGITIAGHESYINEINHIMTNQWSCYKPKNENINILNKLWSNTNKCDFYKYLYTNATIWLQRKRDIFDNYIINNFGKLPSFEMYDITIDSHDHVYFCNGVLTHNCAEELRLAANIYKEPTWINAFNTDQDVHKMTAIKIFGEDKYCKEARKKAKCISGNSLLYTDSGIIPIREINNSKIIGEPIDVDFKLATPEGFCKCSKFIYNGIKQTLKFNMNNGDTLEVTPDHLIRSNNKWIYAKDLKEKDFIDFESIETFNNNYQYINLTYITNATLKFTKELAYYIGAILGDGNISKKNVYFVSEDYELIQYMSAITKMYNLGLAHENVQKYTKTSNKPFIRLNCGAQKAKILCSDIGLINEAGHKIFAVPDIVLKSPNEVKFAFIQGLFDTDGTISDYEGHKHNFCLEFCTKSKQLAIDCSHILKSLGISCRICDSYNKVYGRAYYKLKIRATSAQQFKNLGGFKCIRKQQRLLKWCDTIFVKEYKKHYQILSIEKSESDVYDLTIENDSHSFLANGFVVHNCANFGILYGSSAYGFHHQFPDMTLEECEDFIDKFKSALPSIEAAQNGAIRFGRKNGYVKTYFGRPRRVKYYFNSSNRSIQNFGKRTCMNTQVQGCAGDALKLMLVRLWKELFVPYKDKGVRWLGTIHDEVNVVVPKDLLKEVAPIIMKCQTIKLPDWPVVLLPDMSIGTSFGSLIPFNLVYDENGKCTGFIPQMDEIKEKDLHPGDPVEKDNYIPEVVEDDYDYMQ